MKLRMDNRLVWRGIDDLTAAAIGSRHGDMRFIVALHRCYDKPFIRADTAFTETSTGELCKHAFFKRLKLDCFYGIRLRVKELSPIFGDDTRVAVNLIGICELHNIAIGEFQLEKIRFS